MKDSGSEVKSHKKENRVRGVGLIIHDQDSNQFLFFQRDDIPTIPFPGMIDLIGGHLDEGENPEQALMRELGEELDDLDTGQPYKPEGATQFKRYVDERGTEQNIFGLELEAKPNLRLNEGQRLVWLNKLELGQTDFAFGFKDVVLEYAEKS
jgi:8-oxo-dGTP diphosphatase